MNKQSDQTKKKKRAATTAIVAPIVEVSLEALENATEELKREAAANGLIDTQHTDGATTDPHAAQEQGLVYTPPVDPPVLPSDDLQGAEVAAGFATSMAESNPDVERLPPHVDNNDLDLEEDIATELRISSATSHLDNIRIHVRDGIVYLAGGVLSEEDITIVDEIVRDMADVVDVVNRLQVEE